MYSSWTHLYILSTLHLCLGNLFNTQRKSAIFVDKSELIAAFFNTSTSPYNLITCPFKFGKSTNLEMLALFCDPEVDKKTRKPRPQNNTYAYSVFSQMKISRHRSIMENHLARHPVLHLSFPENLQVTPKTALGAEIKKSMAKYRWLTSLPPSQLGSVDPEDIEYLKQIQSEYVTKLRITEAILRLSRLLYMFFDKSTVVLLIDNYDNTSCRAFVNEADPSYTLEYYKYVNKIVSRALINGTEYISRAMIVGLTSLPFSLPYCDLGMIQHRRFLDDHPFAPYFGYLEHETDQLMVNMSMSKEMRTNALDYYRGYRIRGTNSYIYNPSTTLQFHLHRQKVKTDYTRESLKLYTDPIKEFDLFSNFYQMLRFREKIFLLSLNEQLNLPYDITRYETGALEQLGTLKVRKYFDESDQHTRALLTIFFELGFFRKSTDQEDDNTYTWANIEPRISTMYQIIYRFERVPNYVAVGNVILDILAAEPEANLTQHLEYLRGNMTGLHNVIQRGSDQQAIRLQVQAMVYESIGRRVNKPNAQNVHIVDRIPLGNRTEVTPYDMYVLLPEKKVVGVIAVRFEGTVDEALEAAFSVKLPACFNQSIENVKSIGINVVVVEEDQSVKVDVLVRTERFSSR